MSTPEAHHNEIIRRTANYHPSIWGDQFIFHLPKDKVIACKKHNTLCVCVCVILCYFLLPLRNLMMRLINMVTKAGA